MADLQRVIEVVFQGTDNLGGTITELSSGLESFSAQAQNITGPLASVTDSIIKTELALAGVGVAFLGVAVNESVKFEDALLDLQKVLSDGEGDVAAYIPQIEEIGQTYGIAATNVIESAAAFRQSGFDIGEALELTDLALKAVKISELDVNEASELLISTLRGFGVEADQTNRILDLLNQLSNEYGVSLGELGQGLAELSPLASKAGLSIEETAGLLVPVIEIFGSGSEAATALNTGLNRIGAGTGAAGNALKELAIAQRDANGELRLSGDILRDVAAIWPTLSNAEQQYFAQQLAGLDQARRFQVVLSNYDRVLGATESALNAAGSAQREWEVRMGASREVADRTVNSIRTFLRVIGDEFRAEVTGATGAAGKLAQAFTALVRDGDLEPVFAQLRPLIISIEQDLLKIADALPEAFKGLELDPIIEGFREIGIEVSRLFQGVDLTTPEGLRSALQDIINVGGGFLQITAGIINELTPLIRLIAQAGAGFGELSPEAQKAGGELLGFGKAADLVLGFTGPLVGGLESIGTGLQAVAASTALKTLTGLVGSAKALLAVLGSAGLAGAVGVVSFKLGEWADLNDRLVPGVDTLGTGINRLVNYFDPLEQIQRDHVAVLKQEAIEIDNFAASLDELQRMMANVSDEEKNLIDSEQELAELNKQIAGELEARGLELVGYGNAATKAAQATGEVISETGQLRTEQGALVQVIRDASGAITGYTQITRSKTAAQEADTTALAKATKETDAYRLKMEELASNERIKRIESTVALETADLESQTRRVEAAFESINTSIESTGKLLGTLFGELNEADSWWERSAIEDQIERENELREQSFDLQKRLTDQQISYLREKTRSLSRGDALIKISAEGLEPELEAFMWEIIKRVQVEASDAGAEFLLGIP